MVNRSSPYRAIRDYALIGDGHTAALIATDGSIDWCCYPQFDSPALFCRLLDAHCGGWCRIGPAGPFAATRSYRGNTNILVTEFTANHARWRLTDFMPMHEEGSASRHRAHIDSTRRILRLVEGLEGEASCSVELRPTFDFARGHTEVEITPNGARAHSDRESMSIRSPIPLQLDERDAAIATWTLSAGQRFWFALEYEPARSAHDHPIEFDVELTKTLGFWKEWSERCTYEGPYHPLVRRSALTLKLLTFMPTGAIVAAPTTSLPEKIGGVRNWDYRFSWLRDAAFTLYALQSIGYHQEADGFFDWLESLCLRCGCGLRIMYTLEGGADIVEYTLDHLQGYRDSRPVRIGNAAFDQKQLDVYGEILDAAHLHVETSDHALRPDTWAVLCRLADEATRHWHETDQGIWEVRGGPRHFLYSKLMCWVALDRAIKIQASMGLPAGTQRWHLTRQEIRRVILDQGYNSDLRAFTQSLRGSVLDASALMLPLVGFLPCTDPRVQSTLDTIREHLTAGGLVYRYLPQQVDDGLPGDEATFAACSFWLAENLALSGRVDEARELFERVSANANDVGLLSEQITPHSGDLLGNFPQGFTHLALIRAGLSIAKAESRGPELRAEAPADRARATTQAGPNTR